MKTESKAKSNKILCKKDRNFYWTYHFNYNGKQIQICKKFLMSLYQITDRRIKTIQNKLLSQSALIDKRGFQQKVNKINENIWESFKLFLTLIPSKPSHYTTERSKKRYFDDPELNIIKLYELFIDYYEKEHKIKLTFSYKTFSNYFNKYCNYAFRTPRIDRCDYCVEFENKDNKSNKDLEEFRNHEIKISQYRELKNKLIYDSKNLCLEF
jgi:hypothetical protein